MGESAGGGHSAVGVIALREGDCSRLIGHLADGAKRITQEVFGGCVRLRNSSKAIGVGGCAVAQNPSQASVQIQGVLNSILRESITQAVIGIALCPVD